MTLQSLALLLMYLLTIPGNYLKTVRIQNVDGTVYTVQSVDFTVDPSAIVVIVK